MADTRYPKIIENQTGPNGHPVGYDDDGNYVEWVPDDDGQNDGDPWPIIMRRNENHISAEYQRLWDKVWWNRHMSHCRAASASECPKHGLGCDPARGLEDRYGKEFLYPGDDVEWGICQGKMMALAWVLGSEWEGSGDT